MEFANLNYRHLHYFWVVAKEGSITRAAQRLGVTAQTISGQLSQLERDVGKALLAPQGRGLVLTDAGRLVTGYADRIFALGEELQAALEAQGEESMLQLSVGVVDALPKLEAYRLLQNALQLPQPVRLVCVEGGFDELAAELALHKLDIVLSDRPALAGNRLRISSRLLGEHEMSLFAVSALAVRYREDAPASLHGAPMILPTRNNVLRMQMEQWFEAQGVRPRIVGEFADNALLNAFGQGGFGLFAAASNLAEEVFSQLRAERVCELPGVREQVYVVSAERRIRHPVIEAILRGV